MSYNSSMKLPYTDILAIHSIFVENFVHCFAFLHNIIKKARQNLKKGPLIPLRTRGEVKIKMNQELNNYIQLCDQFLFYFSILENNIKRRKMKNIPNLHKKQVKLVKDIRSVERSFLNKKIHQKKKR